MLVEGDDHTEPIADHVRAILDGHIVLSREIASRNRYPAIDILHSVSRTMPDVTSADHRVKAAQVREWLATIRDSEDLVSVGAYVAGSSPRIDEALARRDAIDRFLSQPADQLMRLPARDRRLAGPLTGGAGGRDCATRMSPHAVPTTNGVGASSTRAVARLESNS